MRLLFNKLKLTTTVELDSGETVDALAIEKKCKGRYLQLVEEGVVEDFMLLAQDLARAYRLQGPPHRQRHLVAVGIPKFPGLTIRPRTLWDIFRGIVARIEIASDAPVIDEHLALGLAAKVARLRGVRLTDVDEIDAEELLRYLASNPERSTIHSAAIRSYRSAKVEYQASFGDILRLRGTSLAVGIKEPELLVDRKLADQVASELHNALLANNSLMSAEDATTMIARFRKRLRQAHAWSRTRAQSYGAVWLLEPSLRIGETASQRIYQLALRISDDNLTATVHAPLECLGGCRDKSTPTYAEVREALQESGLVGIKRETIAELHKRLTERQTIVGYVVAQGQNSVAPGQPYLRIARIKEVQAPMALSGNDHPRDCLPKSFAHKDELVAVIEFAHPGRIGRDIYGRELPALPPPDDAFTAGPGVERRGQRFFALVSGAIKLQANSVCVEDSLIIPGDVSPSIGDLKIPGPLVVQGGVDHGVSIDAQGSVKIGQSFAGRYLRTTGDLEIQGGIVGEDDKLLIVKGDLKVRFVQGGRIRCSGHVTIESHMSGGSVEADGNVTVLSPTGGVFGGRVVAGGSLYATNLGRNTGFAPEVWFGTSPKHWRLLRILEDRQRALQIAKDALLRQGLARPAVDNERSSRKSARVEANDRRLRIDSILGRIGKRLEMIRQTARAEIAAGDKNAQVAIAGITYPDVQVCQESECVDVDVATEGNQFIVKNSKLILQSLPTEIDQDASASPQAAKTP